MPPPRTRSRPSLPTRIPLVLALALALPGCVLFPPDEAGAPTGSYRALGFDGERWPDLHGAKVTVLAYSSFAYAFGEHADAFRNLTNASVVLVTEDDAGQVLQRALAERGAPSFDVIYGIDNVLAGKAIREGVFRPYEPLLGARVDRAYDFLPGHQATPVTHGYVAVNVDPRADLTVDDLDDLRAHASQFVTEDPRTSTPGLGFLVATVATYGEVATDRYDYVDYWNDLFRGGALVVADWTIAYAGHFTGGYGQFEEGATVDRAIVTSYTTSPAYEMHYGYDRLNTNVLAPNATFHQIQTMGIANGTRNAVAAEAWIEFALTDAFQARAAPGEAIYPVVAETASAAAVYQGRDPAPGSFAPAGFTYAELDANVDRWVREWTAAYETHQAAT